MSRDALEIGTALQELPALRSLNVAVLADCPVHAIDGLGKIPQLIHYRQFWGEVSRVALKQFAQAGRLKYLDLALVSIKPGDIQFIGDIRSLEKLDLSNEQQSAGGMEGLAQVCQRLPHLRYWPHPDGLKPAVVKVIWQRLLKVWL